jgi:sugar/nucleoside kinase (ribokinase family)
MRDDPTHSVLVAGHLCLDIIPALPATPNAVSAFFKPGGLVRVGECTMSAGGPVSNTGLALERLGVTVALSGVVGSDEAGEILAAKFKPEQAGSLRRLEKVATSYTVVLAPPGSDRMFLHHAGANDVYGVDDVPWARMAEWDVLHMGYPPVMKGLYANEGEQLVEIYRRAKQSGMTTSMDMALPDPHGESGSQQWHQILERVLPFVDFYLPSVEETAFMLDRDLFEQRKQESQGGDPVYAYCADDLHNLSTMLLEMGAGVVALKCGACGFYLRTAGKARWSDMGRAVGSDCPSWVQRELWAPAYHQAAIASATGSGDSSIAGFWAAFLRGATPETAVQCANAVGWQNLRGFDALSGIEDWQATWRQVTTSGRARNELSPDPKRWVYDETKELYFGSADSQ